MGAKKWKRKGAYFPKFNVSVGYHRAFLLAKYEWQPKQSLGDEVKGVHRVDELDLWFDLSNNGVNKEARLINQLIINALQETGIEILDPSHLREFRADSHPATWLGKKDAVSVWGQDCMHWCLPGVPDTWANILRQLIRYRLERRC